LRIKDSLKVVIKQAEEYMVAAEEANNKLRELMDKMVNFPMFGTMVKKYIMKSKVNESRVTENYLSQIQNLVITPLNDTYVFFFIYNIYISYFFFLFFSFYYYYFILYYFILSKFYFMFLILLFKVFFFFTVLNAYTLKLKIKTNII